MSVDADAGKRKQLEAASSSDVLQETDEQLARRLHEELNALTRHSRRAAAPGPGQQQQQQLQRSRSEKLPDSKAVKQQRQHSDAEAQQLAGGMLLLQQQQQQQADKPARKRSMLNRELAMLVTDMVDSQIKPATGPRQTKSKDEQVVDQHNKGSSEQQQQLQVVEQLLPILKHESSSSQSEQERLALEHVQAAVADGTPQAKLAQQRQQHFVARASDSGADAGGDSACISGAESSGRDSSSSSGEADHGQQHTSPAAPDQRRSQDSEQPRSRQPQQQQQQPPQAAPQGKGKQQDAAAGGGKVIKIPKLPMVEYAKKWYRAKVLKDAGSKVLLEYQGYNHEGGPFWLAKDHARIWRGSYKGRDWKYLGDGAWEPKVANKTEGKSRRTKSHRSSSAAAAAATATTAGDGAAAADSDTEELAGRQQRRQVQQQQKQKKQKHSHRRAAAAAAAGSVREEGEGHADGAVSERDTTSADQQGEAAGEADAAGPSLAEQGEVDSGMQLDEQADEDYAADVAEPPAAIAMEVDQLEQQQQERKPDVQQQQGAGADGAGAAQAAEQPEALQQAASSAEQCNKVLLLQTASSKAADAAEAADAAALAAAAVAAAEALVKHEAEAEAAAAGNAAAAPGDAPAAAPEPAASTGTGRYRPGKAKAAAAPFLLGHTHEEMVAAAAAAVAVAAPPAPRGRATRSGKTSNSTRSNGDGVSEGSSRRGGRGGRGGRGAAAAAAHAAAAKEQQARQEEQQPQQAHDAQQAQQQPAASVSGSGLGLPAGLHVEPGRGLKHSGSSEGPLSPTSPTGGSPRTHRRRKGVPRRARLDSEDLQRPTKKARGAPKPTLYCDTAMEWGQHEQQVQMQQMLEERRQQAALAAQQQQAAWKAAAKNGYGSNGAKKSMWSAQGQPSEFGSSSAREARQPNAWQQERQQQYWSQPSPRALAAAAAAAAAAECQAAIAEQQQQQLALQHQGSEPEDVEAACVLLGAMGRAHSGEVAGVADPAQPAGGLTMQLTQRSFSMTAADEMQLSPRFAAGNRQGGARRRGHNWSKPLGNTSRPPRPPVHSAGQQGSGAAGFRHSLTGSLPQQAHRGLSYSSTEFEGQQEPHSYGALGSAALAAAAAAVTGGDAEAALLGRPRALGVPAALRAQGGINCVGAGADSSGKQQTLRTLLDAVGQVQSASGRPDLMYPMQFGGVPMGTQAPGKNGVLQPLQLLHTPVSAAAATLLAAVPSLDAVQRMAMLQGQGGVLACLTGESPALFL